MERFGLVEDTESYRRWKRKYYKGRMAQRFRAGTYVRGGRGRARLVPLSNARRLSKRVKKLERGITGCEWKTHDVAGGGNMTTAGTIELLTGIQQGDTSLTREGLKIRLQSLFVQGIVNTNSSLDSSCHGRLIIFFDTQQHGTAPVVTDVLETADELALPEHENQNRFIIVKDKHFVITPQISGSAASRFFKIYRKFKGRRIFYIGTGAAAANMGKGQLYALYISGQGTYPPVLDFEARVRFTEG